MIFLEAISANARHAHHAPIKMNDWTGFFGAVAGVSVTLFSVMFVTFQVRYDTWHSSRLKEITALSALFELLVPLFAALITLLADHPWRYAACIAGSLGLITVGIHWTLYYWDRKVVDKFDKLQARGALLSFVIYSTMIAGGVLGTSSGLYLVGGISIWLLLSGAFEAWWHLEPKGAMHKR